MKLAGPSLHLSPTDLAHHLACRHLTTLNHRCERGDLRRPWRDDPVVEVLQAKGLAHEAAYLAHLEAQGRRVVRLSDKGTDVAATRAAMGAGADVIAQAWLEHGRWRGRADVLLRVDGPDGEAASDLGDYHYEVVDTKLATTTKAGTILQLCVYAELLGQIQGRRPDAVQVVTPGTGFTPEVYRLEHYEAYYRGVKARLEAAVADTAGAGTAADTTPEPCDHCNVCDFWQLCDRERHVQDHLSLVAGITRSQRAELTAGFGIQTLTQLGAAPLPAVTQEGGAPKRSTRQGLERVQHQAAVQLRDRAGDTPYYEMLPIVDGEGLTRLPAPSRGDLYFDLEGDPFAGEGPRGDVAGGLEYLFGWTGAPLPAASGAPRPTPVYDYLWADDPVAERAAFEHFVDTVTARRAADPEMHVYHYAPYEPAALKRLMGRYATREADVDELLRGGVFVDLYQVTRQAVRAGVESYSIKQLERFFDYDRQVELRDVARPKRTLEALLEAGRGAEAPAEVRDIVRDYNEDDCVSTWRLHQWLEARRDEQIATGQDVPRPMPQTDEAPESLKEWQAEVQALRARLTEGLSPRREERDDTQQARWLLAYLLDWHWREEKAAWWEFYRLKELTEEELADEKAALAGMTWERQLPKVGRETTQRHRYRWPSQITEIREGDSVNDAEGGNLGSVVGIDMVAQTVDIKHTGKQAEARPTCVYECNVVPTAILRQSLMRLGAWVAEHGVDAGGSDAPHRAGRDLLLGHPPRRRPAATGPLRRNNETGAEAARRLATELDGGCLPIQGPPGAGKTWAGAHMILDLVRQGRRVGVTAVSHKVIENLLTSVTRAAQDERLTIACAHKVSELSTEAPPGITQIKDNAPALAALQSGQVQVLGGTAWLWASETAAGTADVLFVDEAGQMSLANVLAISPAARNLVLLGDPQQLEQPQKGSHPEGTEVSALQHVLGTHSVMPPDRGLFLEQTWRLHPTICAYTSRQFYDGQLTSRQGMERQALRGPTRFAGAGLWVERVAHEGNTSTSDEEVERVVTVVADLLQPGVTWTNPKGQTQGLEPKDILVVAPYNAQVAALQARLGAAARVGTVDRFQGQEAPVVIYSLTASSAEEAPRGMEFLYSLNRLNVATSRARCVCVVVASGRLFEPECRTVRQMRLANGVCAVGSDGVESSRAWAEAERPSG